MKIQKLLVLIAAGVLLAGCSGLRHVNAKRFMAEAQMANFAGTLSGTEYIGAAGGNVYVYYYRSPIFFGSGVHRVYWTRVADLPPDIQAQLRERKNPWARNFTNAVGTGGIAPAVMTGTNVPPGPLLGR